MLNLSGMFRKWLTSNVDSVLNEQQESVCVRNISILFEEQGFLNTLIRNESVDKKGNPIPWYTYPAIEYISQFDLRDKRIFEYGCGNSSLFWAARASQVISVDNNGQWYEAIRKKAPANLEIVLRDTEEGYVNAIDSYDFRFDVIVIDGAFRYATTEKSLSRIAEHGLIILDNSDRAVALEEYSRATALLREAGFIQVDMSGFGPLNRYTWTTSFFFTRNFNFRTSDNIQPHKPVGGNVMPVLHQVSG